MGDYKLVIMRTRIIVREKETGRPIDYEHITKGGHAYETGAGTRIAGRGVATYDEIKEDFIFEIFGDDELKNILNALNMEMGRDGFVQFFDRLEGDEGLKVKQRDGSGIIGYECPNDRALPLSRKILNDMASAVAVETILDLFKMMGAIFDGCVWRDCKDTILEIYKVIGEES